MPKCFKIWFLENHKSVLIQTSALQMLNPLSDYD